MALLNLKVSPKASRNAITGFLGEVLKVSVTSAPERGKANEAVEELLARALDLPRNSVRVVAGQTSRNKRLEVSGLSEAEIVQRLRTILGQNGRPGR